MCVNLRGIKIKPGAVIPVFQKDGRSVSVWGFNGGEQYNARSERLDSIYTKFIRGFITIDTFWEGGKEFRHVEGVDFNIAVILNPSNEFAILTRQANEIVKPYHHRMPVLLHNMEQKAFLDGEFHHGLWLPDNLVTLKEAA